MSAVVVTLKQHGDLLLPPHDERKPAIQSSQRIGKATHPVGHLPTIHDEHAVQTRFMHGLLFARSSLMHE
jgi:hypothetical protein